jgi:hypothetical protein
MGLMFTLGFLVLALVSLWNGKLQLERAVWFEEDPNYREQAPRVRRMGYIFQYYGAACAIGSLMILVWMMLS